jgi:hypothetical protein
MAITLQTAGGTAVACPIYTPPGFSDIRCYCTLPAGSSLLTHDKKVNGIMIH